MSYADLDQQILVALRAGHTTRAKLMAIERLRHRTWAVVVKRLEDLARRGSVVASKGEWRAAR